MVAASLLPWLVVALYAAPARGAPDEVAALRRQLAETRRDLRHAETRLLLGNASCGGFSETAASDDDEVRFTDIFGSANHMDRRVLTLTFLALTGAIILIEHCLSNLDDHLTHTESPYRGMVEKVYRELMIIALVSLVLLPITMQKSVSNETLHIIEFADLVMVSFSFFLVVHACGLVVLASRRKRLALTVPHSHRRHPTTSDVAARAITQTMGAFECIERLYEARRSLTLFTLVVNLCFGMAFSITTFNVVGRCVTEPCVAETAGLLRINSGTSFGLLLTGFLFILQPVYGLWFFRVKCSDVVGGAFVGATVMLSLQAMMTSSQWSYVAKGVATMDPIVASSGVVVKGNETFFSAFEAIAALAGLMCALLILNAIELSFCLEYFCDNDAAKLRAQRFAERIRRGYQYQGVHQSSDATVDDDDLDDDI